MPNIQAGLSPITAPPFQRRSQTGFTLLELFFVLAIAAVLVLLSVSQYKRHQVSKDLELVRYNVDLVFQAANQCFWANRSSPDTSCSSITLPTLFVNNNKLTPSKTNYTVKIVPIENVTPPNYTVQVTVQFPNVPNSATLTWYENKLNATTVDAAANTLIWKRLPTYNTPTSDTNLWINNAQLQQFRNAELKSP